MAVVRVASVPRPICVVVSLLLLLVLLKAPPKNMYIVSAEPTRCSAALCIYYVIMMFPFTPSAFK